MKILQRKFYMKQFEQYFQKKFENGEKNDKKQKWRLEEEEG